MRVLIVAAAVLVLLSGAVGVSATDTPDVVQTTIPVADDTALLPIVEAVNSDPDNFGVPFLDDKGVLVLPYVGQNAGRGGVEQRVTADVKVRWQMVEYSQSELRRIRSEISALRLEGVFSVSSGTSRNRVIVKVGPSGSVDKVAAALGKYGAAVVVESSDDLPLVNACNDRFDCTRWRGGIAIYRTDTLARCTWGFQANRDGYLMMVTAGHCHKAGGKFSHDGVTIATGGVSKNAINPATFEGIDAERMWVNGTYYPTTQNILYLNDVYKSWTMTSVRSNANFFVGMLVQKAGSTTNFTDGYLDDVENDLTITVNNPGEMPHYPACYVGDTSTCPVVTLAHSNTYIQPGDSGAPVFLGNIFLGIVSAGGGANLYFTRQQDAKAALDLDFWCTTSGC